MALNHKSAKNQTNRNFICFWFANCYQENGRGRNKWSAGRVLEGKRKQTSMGSKTEQLQFTLLVRSQNNGKKKAKESNCKDTKRVCPKNWSPNKTAHVQFLLHCFFIRWITWCRCTWGRKGKKRRRRRDRETEEKVKRCTGVGLVFCFCVNWF